ncbi:hypothetical protein E2C01_046097 [Portunus trituberculatus]|uniref:Uncharacterized protein n=1 Tax=Portunus trituberculatus TaxID=210409 RepID=A0A5B7G6P5_PORTR|nr:hypothetical protein [Portunus trituberculatus]
MEREGVWCWGEDLGRGLSGHWTPGSRERRVGKGRSPLADRGPARPAVIWFGIGQCVQHSLSSDPFPDWSSCPALIGHVIGYLRSGCKVYI